MARCASFFAYGWKRSLCMCPLPTRPGWHMVLPDYGPKHADHMTASRTHAFSDCIPYTPAGLTGSPRWSHMFQPNPALLQDTPLFISLSLSPSTFIETFLSSFLCLPPHPVSQHILSRHTGHIILPGAPAPLNARIPHLLARPLSPPLRCTARSAVSPRHPISAARFHLSSGRRSIGPDAEIQRTSPLF